MNKINDHFKLLGCRVRDKVTKFKGIVTSLSFDVYGCIQVMVDAEEREEKKRDCMWLDIVRVEVLSKKPIVNPPDWFNENPVQYYERLISGAKGAANKVDKEINP